MAALLKGNAVAPDPTFRLWIPAARPVGTAGETRSGHRQKP